MKQNHIYNDTLNSLNRSWADYERLLLNVRRKPSRKEIHELRNSIQRLTAILDLSSQLRPFPRSNHLIKEMQKERKSLGPLRNAQVELQLLRSYKKSSLYKYLKKRLAKAKSQALQSLQKVSLKTQRSQIQEIKNSLSANDQIPASDEASRRLENEIRSQQRHFERILPKTSRFSIQKAHELRIAAKEILYQGQALRQILGEAKVDLAKFEKIHQLVGELQNEAQLLKVIDKFLHKKSRGRNKTAEALRIDLTVDQEQLWLEVEQSLKSFRWRH